MSKKGDTKDARQEIDGMIAKLQQRRAEFVTRRRAERQKEHAADLAGTGADVPQGDDIFSGLTVSDISDIELKFNEVIATCRERLRQLDIADKRAWLKTLPAEIEKLDVDVQELERIFTEKKKALFDMQAALKNGEIQIDVWEANPERIVAYKRHLSPLLDERLPGHMKKSYMSYILNY